MPSYAKVEYHFMTYFLQKKHMSEMKHFMGLVKLWEFATYKATTFTMTFKGIVSRDFRGLQMILMDRAWIPGVPLDE